MNAVLNFRGLLIAEYFTESVVSALHVSVDSDGLYICRHLPVRKYTCLRPHHYTCIARTCVMLEFQ
jgi:hypothetical protein